MRSTLLIALLLFTASLAPAQPPPLINPTVAGVDVDLPANATADQVLDALDQRGQTLKEFTASVSITEGDPNVGDVSTRTGRLWFQKKGNDDGRMRITFDKRIVGRITQADKVEYKLDGGWLIDRDYHKKAETRRQVIKPGEKINLLKLGEGPFPLPIGQKKEDVYKLFNVKVIAPAKDDDKTLAGTIHLQLIPKPGTQFARKFGNIDVWVSRTTRFPARIVTAAPDGSDEHKTNLDNVQINPLAGLKDEDFKLPDTDADWSLRTEPYKD